jgi:hypothetical protein
LPTCLPRVQAIIFRDNKSIGRLVGPKLEVSHETFCLTANCWDTVDVPLRILNLVYDTWQPLSADKKSLSSIAPLRLPIDEDFRASLFRFQVIGRQEGESFALPFAYTVSGSDTAASASQQLQKINYIRHHQSLRGSLQEPLAQSCLPLHTVKLGEHMFAQLLLHTYRPTGTSQVVQSTVLED